MKLDDLVSYTTSREIKSLEELDSKKITFIMSKDGMLRYQENKIGSFVVKEDGDEHFKYLPAIKTGFKFNLPKIPGEILGTTISFFKAVLKEKNGAEAMVQIFWDDVKRSHFIHCLEQDVDGASVIFRRDIKLEKEYTLIADIHSHNSMSAFFSSTDDKDEKECRLFSVCGKLDTKRIQILLRAGCAGNYVDIKPQEIFTFIPTKTYEFPSNWMSKIKYIPVIETERRHADLDRKYGFTQLDFSDSLFGGSIYSTDNTCPWCGQSLKKKTRKGVDW